MHLNGLNRDMFKPFVLIDVSLAEFLVVCLRTCTGLKGVSFRERSIYESNLVGQTNCSHNASQNVKCISCLSDKWTSFTFLCSHALPAGFLDVDSRVISATRTKKLLTRVSERVPGAHGRRGLERGCQKRLAKGWRKVGEGLAQP